MTDSPRIWPCGAEMQHLNEEREIAPSFWVPFEKATANKFNNGLKRP